MSVLIKGMEMPVSCAACSLQSYDIDDQKFCGADREGRSIHFDLCRPSWCPLVPIPPHGRLIDADALKADYFVPSTTSNSPCWVYVSMEEIKNTPTIIPAEEGEKNADNRRNKH